jgi:phosphoglucomutase/phosphomannomutase
LVIKTQVTTELMARIAEDFGAAVIGDLLVGFKYIGNIIDQLEREGRFGDVEATPADFVVAAEESHGLLLTPQIRDKDAAGAAVVLAELASELKESGSGIYDYLIDTYKRYGYHRSLLRSTIMQGAAGTAAMAKIQEEIRASRPASMGGLKVFSIVDYWDEKKFGVFKSETDRGSRNLLTLVMEGGLKVSIRPSGTEPKNKVYIEKASEPLGAGASDESFAAIRQAVDREVEEFSNIFMKEMLAIVGVKLPRYAMEISDLVALERKQHFAERFVPSLAEKVEGTLRSQESAETVDRWIDQELKSYGPDARLLVGKAFRSYLAGEREKGSSNKELLAAEERVFFGAAPQPKDRAE